MTLLSAATSRSSRNASSAPRRRMGRSTRNAKSSDWAGAVVPRSEDLPHAVGRGEQGACDQSYKVTALDDALSNEDGQQRIAKDKAAANRKDDRNEQQQQENRQQHLESEHDADHESHQSERNGRK